VNEQRQHPRYAIGLDVSAAHDGGKVTGRTRDLSRGGLCMLSDDSIPVGKTCEVNLALVFSENQFSENMVLPSLCVWCTPIKGGQHQIGFKFEPLGPQNRAYLDLFIKFLASGQDDDGDGRPDDEPEDDEQDDPFGG
jgi:hypothetical protein